MHSSYSLLPRSAVLRLHAAAILAAALACGAPRPTTAQVTGGAPPAADPHPAVIVGTVVDRSTGNPVPGASVVVPERTRKVVADGQGRFVMANVEPGEMKAFVGRIGYARKQETWMLEGGDTTQVLVSLLPDAVMLDALKVQVDRLDARVRATGWSARSVKQDELELTTASNAADFVVTRFGLVAVHCGLSTAGPPDCIRIRGATARPCVVVDERYAMSGFSELSTYRAQDLYRVDVYRGGAFVQAYTTAFMENSALHPWAPMPAEAQYNAFCGTQNRGT
jgi:hypothetical protein